MKQIFSPLHFDPISHKIDFTSAASLSLSEDFFMSCCSPTAQLQSCNSYENIFCSVHKQTVNRATLPLKS